MNEQLKHIIQASLLLLSVSLLVWIIFPIYTSYALGFMLGMIISFINAWILLTKIEALSRNIVERTEKRVNLGFVSRVCMAIIAVMIAIKMPQINLVFTIIGLFSIQIAALVMGMFSKKE